MPSEFERYKAIIKDIHFDIIADMEEKVLTKEEAYKIFNYLEELFDDVDCTIGVYDEEEEEC